MASNTFLSCRSTFKSGIFFFFSFKSRKSWILSEQWLENKKEQFIGNNFKKSFQSIILLVLYYLALIAHSTLFVVSFFLWHSIRIWFCLSFRTHFIIIWSFISHITAHLVRLYGGATIISTRYHRWPFSSWSWLSLLLVVFLHIEPPTVFRFAVDIQWTPCLPNCIEFRLNIVPDYKNKT